MYMCIYLHTYIHTYYIHTYVYIHRSGITLINTIDDSTTQYNGDDHNTVGKSLLTIQYLYKGESCCQ